MKRRTFLAQAGSGLAATAFAAPAIAQVTPPGQMAPRLQLPQEPRHDLRRRSILLRARLQADRRPVRDHSLRGRADRARAAGPRRGAARHHRMRAHRLLLLRRQESRLRLRLRDSLRSQFTPAIGVGISPAAVTSCCASSTRNTGSSTSPRATPGRRWAGGSRRSRPSRISRA